MVSKPIDKLKWRAGVLICLLLDGCQGPPPNVPHSPNEYMAREDCLYRTLCAEIRKRGAAGLEEAASHASTVCRLPISRAEDQQTKATNGRSTGETREERMANLEFDWHAMAVAQQLKERCVAPQ